MDFDSSSKFISSLAKFLQSLCNGYVEFDNGVEVIGHIYLNVDTGKKIDYVLNEKVCKTDQNSVTFISNSFHAQPAEKPKPPPKPVKAATEPERPTLEAVTVDEEEIFILEESELKSEHSAHPSNLGSKPTVRPTSASKRSYQQSFPQQKQRPTPVKMGRSNPPSVQNPNGAHDTDSHHSDPGNSSSSGYHGSQSLPPTDSTADASRLPVFPQTSSNSTNSRASSFQNIKEEPSSGENDYNVNVKQEIDPSAHGEDEHGIYDDQDQSGYGYGEEYYGEEVDPSQRHLAGGSQQGEFYQGVPGPSGQGASGDGTGALSVRWVPGRCCPVRGCPQSRKPFGHPFVFKRHWKLMHEEIVSFHHCSACSFMSKLRANVHRHFLTKHPSMVHSVDVKIGQVDFQYNQQFIDPYPLTLEQVLCSSLL